MKTKTTQFCVIVASMALLNVGYGAPGTYDLPDPLEALQPPAAPDRPPILLASELLFQRIVQTQTTFIQHEATERQRKIAQAHALTFIKHLEASTKRPEPKHPDTYSKRQEPEKKVATAKPKVPRYIAVDTEKNAQTSPKAKKVVMVWDTQSESLVGNTVYDLPDPPSVGKPIVFATYSAEYVGGN